MKKRIIFTLLLVLLWFFWATLFYKALTLMLIALTWQSKFRERLPERIRPWGLKVMWLCLAVVLWVSMPRYRINCGDRVRMVYLNEKGEAVHAPLSYYFLNTLFPEEEVANIGTKCLTLSRPLLKLAGIGVGGSLFDEVKEAKEVGKLGALLEPYDNLGLNNPLSGIYPQFFDDSADADRPVYICDPADNETVAWSKDNGYKYPLVVFCHGYLGNWQLYQGVWKDLNDCIILSIGTRDLSGIFTPNDLKDVFTFYIPALKRMGYNIDEHQLHLVGLSNGGSAIVSAMNSQFARKFKSLTSVSANLVNVRRVPCQVNLIGGGKDAEANLLPAQCNQLKALGVDAAIYFKEADGHFILMNEREEIIRFLRERIQLKCVKQ